jgi:RNA polymerase sigma factor (sigma-70 family)
MSKIINKHSAPSHSRANPTSNSLRKASGMTSAFLVCESALKRFLSRFFYRPEDVDELAQETFLRAFDASKTTDVQSPEAYLFRVAKHIALKELDRKSTKMTDYLEEALEHDALEGNATIEQELMAEQKIASYCAAIATLPPQCRKVFLMRKVQAKSYREIAQTLNISLSAVEKHIAKGMNRFDDHMKNQGQEQQSQCHVQQVSAEIVQSVGDAPTRSPHE